MLVFFTFILCALAQEPDGEIVVEAHKNLELYVAPTIVINNSKGVDSNIDKTAIFSYASIHSKYAKQKGKYGYDKVDNFYTYNIDTIAYVWEDCDYKKDAKKCSYKNNHYLLESYITINTNQVIVRMMLFDPELQIISQSVTTSTKAIRWIRQQELTIHQSTNPFGGSQTQISKPKEELPLKWEISHRLLDKEIHQASLLLWSSTKLD